MVRSRGAFHQPPPITRATTTSAPAPRRSVLMCACRWVISFLKRLIARSFAWPFGWTRSLSARSADGLPPSPERMPRGDAPLQLPVQPGVGPAALEPAQDAAAHEDAQGHAQDDERGS